MERALREDQRIKGEGLEIHVGLRREFETGEGGGGDVWWAQLATLPNCGLGYCVSHTQRGNGISKKNNTKGNMCFFLEEEKGKPKAIGLKSQGI